MPTYEFRCANGHEFEQFHKISDAPSTVPCPTCGAVAERAISGGAGLVFKGSGFYLTDYGKNAHRSSGPAKSGESKSSGDGAGKSEGSGGTGNAGGGASGGGASSGGSSSGSSGGSTSTPSASPAKKATE